MRLLRVLIVEDNADDAELLLRELRRAGFDPEWSRVDTELDFVRAIQDEPEIILSDYSMHGFSGLRALELLRASGREQPFILVSGAVGEEVAVQAMRDGATDYLFKDRLIRLGSAVRRALTDTQLKTERKQVEAQLFAEKERAQVTLHSIGDAVITIDAHGHVTYLNAAAERLTRWNAAEATGLALRQVFNAAEAAGPASMHDPSAEALLTGKTASTGLNTKLIRRDGAELLIEGTATPMHQQDGVVIGVVIVSRDVTKSRAMAQRMAHLALHDGLTELANRALLEDRITQAIALARRDRTRVGIVFVDLDRFKQINDTLGHTMGDALLRSVAARLLACVRATDAVSRPGGDEFVVLLTQLQQADHAARVADKILTALSAPHEIGTHALHVTASVGISVFPEDGDEPQALISAADAAMYHAKQSGGNNVQFFTPDMNARRVARGRLESSLRLALERREFVLHYQPKISLKTHRVVGVEALVRWHHPTCGLVPPGEFVPVAEECGLILQLGEWVLREACRQTREWQVAGLPATRVAVNVSAMEIRDAGFVQRVSRALVDTGLAAPCLELEVTESVLMAGAASTAAALHPLKDLGVCFAIDDFGTGYSSLSYLTRFPIDTLKIDRSFINRLTLGGQDAVIVEAIVAMGHRLKLCVVAEGLETAEQLALLEHLSCQEAQGYYFSPPVGAEAFGHLLAREA